MKEFIEKLIGRLEELKIGVMLNNKCCKQIIDKIIEIVNELAEEHNGGWIPCSEYVPQDGDWVLCFGKNREGRIKYEVSTYAHEIQCWMCSRIADVIAWQPLPAPYNPKGE